jgi:hypothetical protein
VETILKKSILPQLLLASSVIFGVAACGGGGSDDPVPAEPTPTEPAPTEPAPTEPTPTEPTEPTPTEPAQPTAGDTTAVTVSNRLVTFNRADPSVIVSDAQISGLEAGENILDIDYRPANGQLYGLTSSGRVATIDPATGAATVTAALTPFQTDPFAGLQGENFGIDFDPASDRLRVVSDAGQNLRVNVDNGLVITGTAFAGIAPSDLAYTNSFAGSDASATPFVLDANADTVAQVNIGGGTAGASKPIGADIGPINGFDIDGRTNVGYAAATVNGTSTLYTIDPSIVTSGSATLPAGAVGTIGTNEEVRGIAVSTPAAPTVIGLAEGNRLVTFAALAPTTFTADVAISGLVDGERILGIDVRPSNGQLYGIANTGNVYSIDTATGAATLTATATTALSGEQFGVDFNPVADLLRVVSNNGQNLRINVETGETTTDGNLNPSGSTVVASAYSNSYPGSIFTILYNIDSTSDAVLRQNPPNDGALESVGVLGVNVVGDAGFDIAGGASGLSLAAINNGTSTSLYRVSFRSGTAGLINTDPAQSTIGAGDVPLSDIAIILK